MKYERVRSKKIYEEVADSLKGAIEKGDLKPGDRLESVEKLAERFAVGRSAIREALSALRATGLVDIRHGEGTFVRSYESIDLKIPYSSLLLVNPKEIKELLEVRKILEVGSVQAAAKHRTEEDLQQMKEALHLMNIHMDDEKLGEKADWAFHMQVARASKNDMLVRLLQSVADLTVETMLETRRIWLYSEKVRAEQLHEEHMAIYTAIEKRQVARAGELMMDHLQSVESLLSQYIN
ncbi:lactate-responsive regulator LldR [Geomicrobium sp. JCM 19037]|uniref:FadR/GntR family transcriptional regulator n=1 Tax=Geomicrobium sp. JCM 19037 TaxID=1460634 RepID=UPI00045F4D05|nr:FadR/GntR family transcriptional regulator [Geomicrobium sp. JCM 19037]GAK02525.1 lactate-responsive regulator LldR [Geomicrobium sp. JCM 19037]